MELLAARTALVGGAVGLVALGVLAPTSGVARAVAIGAGLVLALLDRSLLRSARTAPKPQQSAWSAAVPVSTSLAGSSPGGSEALSASEGTDDEGRISHDRSVLVGHALDDARAVRTDAPHIVVLGRGVLARAVFDAVVAQCHADVTAVRHSDDLPGDLTAPPDGVAVAVCTDPTGSRRTVVLVAEHDQVPRRTDLLVTVGRTGCSVRTDDGRMVRILPVLPRVEPPAAPGGSDQDTSERRASVRRAGARQRSALSAGRLRRGRPPPARPRRGPARRSPP